MQSRRRATLAKATTVNHPADPDRLGATKNKTNTYSNDRKDNENYVLLHRL